MPHAAPIRDPLVLLIGGVDSEGVRSTVAQVGRRYKRKSLHSNPDNWISICQLFETHMITLALVKLTGHTYRILSDPEYSSVAKDLLNAIASTPHGLFVHESVYSAENFDQGELQVAAIAPENEWDYSDVFTAVPEEVRIAVNQMLIDANIRVLTYRKNAEVTVLARELLDRTERGLLFRIYVPNAQLWANETDRLLQLFREYLTRIVGPTVRLDENRTAVGVIYEFYGESDAIAVPLQTQFEEFSEFMSLCISAPEEAQAILKRHGLPTADVLQVLTRYSKEAKRIYIDIKHERELKILHIRQKIESEIADRIPHSFNEGDLEELIDMAVPRVLQRRAPMITSRAALSDSRLELSNVTVNVNPQFIQAVHGIVAQEITGDASLTSQDQQLLRLIDESAGERHAELVSALRELADLSAPKPGRLLARQNILGFLRSLGTKVVDGSVDLLKKYVEKKMLGL